MDRSGHAHTGVKMRLRGLLLYHDGKELYFSRGYRLYRSTDGGRSAERVATLPRSEPREKLARGVLGRRLTRGYIRHLLPVDGGWVALAGRRFYRLRSPGAHAAEAAGGSPSGGAGSKAAPLVPEPGAYAVGRQPFHLAATPAGLYYGEYRSNPERSPVGIYKSVDGGRSFTLHTRFEGVRHIHGVFTDPWEPGTLLAATGDENAEAAVWRVPETGTARGAGAAGAVRPERIAGGSQRFRAVTLIPSEEAIYFGSDTPQERNFIYRLDRQSGALEACAEVGGSVFWGASLPDGSLAFSTVVEPSTVNRSRHAELWLSRNGARFFCIRRYREDPLPPKLFQYAQIRFPAGPGAADELWATPFACWAHERSVALDLTRGAG